MTFKEITDNLWALVLPGEEVDELEKLFDNWNDIEFLHEYFEKYKSHLRYFGVDLDQAVIDTLDGYEEICDILLTGNFEKEFFFEPWSEKQKYVLELQLQKGKRRDNIEHDCWLRIYAIKLEEGVYVITGGGIKLTDTIQRCPELMEEKNKIEKCKIFLKNNNISTQEQLKELITNNEII